MKKATEENLKNRFGVRHVDMRVHSLLDEDGITDRAWMETNVSERNKAKYVMTFFIHSSLCNIYILRNNNNKKLSDR